MFLTPEQTIAAGGHAYPGGGSINHGCLTVRDYFAAAALAGLLAAHTDDTALPRPVEAAGWAYDLADAMLAARAAAPRRAVIAAPEREGIDP